MIRRAVARHQPPSMSQAMYDDIVDRVLKKQPDTAGHGRVRRRRLKYFRREVSGCVLACLMWKADIDMI